MLVNVLERFISVENWWQNSLLLFDKKDVHLRFIFGVDLI